MRIVLPIKALSVNAAYRGRRFDSVAKKQYDRILAMLLPRRRVPGEWYRITYRFHLVNFGATDQQNLLKCLTDGLVRQGIISDDKKIIWELIEKFKAPKDSIEVVIEGLEEC